MLSGNIPCPNWYIVAVFFGKMLHQGVLHGFFHRGVKTCRFDSVKAKKPRAEKYDTKLAINGTFANVIKASVIPMPANTKVIPKKDKPKKK